MSGSAVVDATDASGLFGGGAGLVAFYTSFNHDAPNGNQSVRAAYSADHGRTWQLEQSSPAVENPGGPGGSWDFRDPKVTWDAAAGKWIMVVAAGDHLRFYTSTDLLRWTFASTFGYGSWVRGGVLECPDFFELPVGGQPGLKRWVLWWSTGAVRSTSNWDYAFSQPTGRWNGQLSVPREISLRTCQAPGLGSPRNLSRKSPVSGALRGRPRTLLLARPPSIRWLRPPPGPSSWKPKWQYRPPAARRLFPSGSGREPQVAPCRRRCSAMTPAQKP